MEQSSLTLKGGNILSYKYVKRGNDRPTLIVFPGGPGFGYELYESHSGHLIEYVK